MIFKNIRSGEDYKTIIIDGQFECMNASLFENPVCMEKSLKIAEVEPNNISGIIIVGGASIKEASWISKRNLRQSSRAGLKEACNTYV